MVAGTTHGGTLGVKWWKVVHGSISLTIVMRGKPTASMHRKAAVLGARNRLSQSRTYGSVGTGRVTADPSRQPTR